jgi:uncharacterized phage-like protein YoqJ
MKRTQSRDNTCCFSGYRPNKLPWSYHETDERCLLLKKKLYDVITAAYHSGIWYYICGMAMGCDMYFSEAILKFRETHPDVTLEAALPCEDQAAKWNEAIRERYFRLLRQCDKETYVSRRYTPNCMLLRNKYMVDKSATLIAVYDGRFGGTMHTVGYAEANGLDIIQLRP